MLYQMQFHLFLAERHLAGVHRVYPVHTTNLLLMSDLWPSSRDLDQQRIQATPLNIAEARRHLAHQSQAPVGATARQ